MSADRIASDRDSPAASSERRARSASSSSLTEIACAISPTVSRSVVRHHGCPERRVSAASRRSGLPVSHIAAGLGSAGMASASNRWACSMLNALRGFDALRREQDISSRVDLDAALAESELAGLVQVVPRSVDRARRLPADVHLTEHPLQSLGGGAVDPHGTDGRPHVGAELTWAFAVEAMGLEPTTSCLQSRWHKWRCIGPGQGIRSAPPTFYEAVATMVQSLGLQRLPNTKKVGVANRCRGLYVGAAPVQCRVAVSRTSLRNRNLV